MVRTRHWHLDGNIKYVCEDGRCKVPHMESKETQMNNGSKVVKASSLYSVWIDIPNQGHTQIPARYILQVDAVFSWLRQMGSTGPDLKLWLGPTKDGPTMWQCEMGGFTTASVTPWGALTMMGKIIMGGVIMSDED